MGKLDIICFSCCQFECFWLNFKLLHLAYVENGKSIVDKRLKNMNGRVKALDRLIIRIGLQIRIGLSPCGTRSSARTPSPTLKN